MSKASISTNTIPQAFSRLRLQGTSSDIRAHSTIDVALRIRPEKSTETASLAFKTDSKNQTLQVRTIPQKRNFSTKHEEQQKLTDYKFNHIFDKNTSQKKLYNSVIKQRVDNVLVKHDNSVIMDYGCTGSGKTFTLLGQAKENPGMLTLALEHIFTYFEEKNIGVYTGNDIQPDKAENFSVQSIKKFEIIEMLKSELLEFSEKNDYGNSSKDKTSKETRPAARGNISSYYGVYLSMIEIYNENVLDLFDATNVISHISESNLGTSTSRANKQPLEPRPTTIFEDKYGNPYVRCVNWLPIHNVQEAIGIVMAGKKKRHVAATALNNQSSRAHCIINIRLGKIGIDKNNQPDVYSSNIISSQLTFIDLAGAERADKASLNQQKSAERLLEAGKIHTSLLTLSRVIQILKENSNTIENQKNNKKNSLSSASSGASTQSMMKQKYLKPVPFRESKLTRLLQRFFTSGNCNLMIVNITLASDFLEETTHVLKFSSVAKDVTYTKKSLELADNSRMNFTKLGLEATSCQIMQNLENIAEKENTDPVGTQTLGRSTRNRPLPSVPLQNKRTTARSQENLAKINKQPSKSRRLNTGQKQQQNKIKAIDSDIDEEEATAKQKTSDNYKQQISALQNELLSSKREINKLKGSLYSQAEAAEDFYTKSVKDLKSQMHLQSDLRVQRISTYYEDKMDQAAEDFKSQWDETVQKIVQKQLKHIKIEKEKDKTLMNQRLSIDSKEKENMALKKQNEEFKNKIEKLLKEKENYLLKSASHSTTPLHKSYHGTPKTPNNFRSHNVSLAVKDPDTPTITVGDQTTSQNLHVLTQSKIEEDEMQVVETSGPNLEDIKPPSPISQTGTASSTNFETATSGSNFSTSYGYIELKKHIEDLKNEKHLQISKCFKLENELRQLDIEFKKQQYKIQDLEASKNSEKEKYLNEISELEKVIEESKSDSDLKSQLIDELESNLKDFDLLKVTLDAKIEVISELTESIRKYENEIVELKSKLLEASSSSKLDELKDRLNHMESAKLQVEMFLEEKEHELMRTEMEFKEFKASVSNNYTSRTINLNCGTSILRVEKNKYVFFIFEIF